MSTRHRVIPSHAATRGFSLVEIMISLVIGLVVIGAVFSNYLSTVTGQRSGSAIGQMTEDASLAFNLIRRQVAMAGYSVPTGYSSTGLNKRYTGAAIFGCNTDFSDTAKSLTTFDTLSCADTTAANPPANSIAVVFEADSTNSVLKAGSNEGNGCTYDRPYDVTGSVIACTTVGGAKTYMAQSRFYISGNTLTAWGIGGTTTPGTTTPLVDNVVAMRIWYGLSDTDPTTGLPNANPIRYVDANTVGTTPAAATWRNVRSVRICLVVKSEKEVLDEVTPYYGCNAVDATTPSTTTPTDRALYRAFTSTIMIQNL